MSPISQQESPFFRLPYELRLLVYEALFVSQNAIVISPQKQHVAVVPVQYGGVFALEPVRAADRLAISFLATSRQVNAEGTTVLYGQNEFLVGHRIMLHRAWGFDPFLRHMEPYLPFLQRSFHPSCFLLWDIRCSTLRYIRSIIFVRSCKCPVALSLAVIGMIPAWKTTGHDLLKRASQSKSKSKPTSRVPAARTRMDSIPGRLPLPPALAKNLYFDVCSEIVESERKSGTLISLYCETCKY